MFVDFKHGLAISLRRVVYVGMRVGALTISFESFRMSTSAKKNLHYYYYYSFYGCCPSHHHHLEQWQQPQDPSTVFKHFFIVSLPWLFLLFVVVVVFFFIVYLLFLFLFLFFFLPFFSYFCFNFNTIKELLLCLTFLCLLFRMKSWGWVLKPFIFNDRFAYVYITTFQVNEWLRKGLQFCYPLLNIIDWQSIGHISKDVEI